jgi:general stress protein 26
MFAPDILNIINNYRTCEFATISKSSRPSAHPVTPWYRDGMDHILVTTSIGFPQKIYNIRRNPKVSLLFSNPTASGITSGAMVAVQGDARLADSLTTLDELEDFWRQMYRWQPASKAYSRTALSRYLFDWYYIRMRIYVTPRRVLYWPSGDFSHNPEVMDFS